MTAVIRVLLDDLEATEVDRLRHNLPLEDYELVVVDPREPFGTIVSRCQPHVAVLNRIHAHRPETHGKIDALKEICPRVRIIAISEESSEEDATIVERGIFFYMNSAGGSELVRIIKAGAATAASEEDTMHRRT